jgi:glyoxylase-like metal-dependent hydrolase (beta-lactamase superfamily II)
MKIGKFQIDVVETGLFALDGGAMFGVVPKALWAKAYSPGDDLNRIPLAARPLLVRWEGKTILIDTGNGNKMKDRLASIYNIDKEKSSIVDALKPFNVSPEEITGVILTHLHFDHAGGSTIYKNDKIEPTFMNAKYYVQKQQLLWAQNPSEKDKASYLKDDYEPLVAAGMLELLDGDGDLFPGISVIPVNGHSKFMQIVKISDAGKTILYCADLCPTSAHIPVPYVMGYDNNPMTTIEEKKRILPVAYEDNWTIIYEHDAFAQASTVISTEKGFSAGEKVVITEMEKT